MVSQYLQQDGAAHARIGMVASRFRSLSQQFIYSALGREAIAPLWEVLTALQQAQAGDPQAGLTELQRAQRNNQLAPALAAGATAWASAHHRQGHHKTPPTFKGLMRPRQRRASTLLSSSQGAF